MLKDISISIPKVDHTAKAKGQAVYVDDLRLEDCLYAITFRSTIAHGRIRTRQYPELPEGYTLIDASHIPGENVVHMIFDDARIFAKTWVTYIGEPLGLMIGPEPVVLVDLINQIKITYEPLKPEFDWVDSAVHYAYEKGDPSVLEKDTPLLTTTFQTGYQEHVYIEPQGMIGMKSEGQVVLIGSIQCPYYVKNAVMRALGCDQDHVRVIQAVTGGAFGGKEEFPSFLACQLAVAVHHIGRPIRLIYDRGEDMAYTTKRHPSKTQMSAFVDPSGYVTGFQTHIGLDGGAHLGLSSVVLQRAMIAACGVYRIPNLSISGDVYRTHTVPTGAFRGFGAPQMMFAVEMMMHHLAKAVGEDSVSFRLRHLAKQGDLTATSGHFKEPIILKEMVERAKVLSDYEAKHQKYEDPNCYKGIGLSLVLHGCGFTGSGEQDHIKATVKLRKEASNQVIILIASVDMGQGVLTTMRKLVAHILEMPIEQVTLNEPDTNLVPDSGPTVASRTMMVVGGLVSEAAKSLKDEWQDGVTQTITKHYVQPKDVVWDADTFQGDAYPAYAFGVNVVEVAFSPLTYEVTVVGTWSVYDVGKAIDERIVKGQADGGLLQGLGYGMMEHMVHHEGNIRQRTLSDYLLPTASDAPPMVTELMDNPYEMGPFGAKGAGELTLIGGAPAVAMAIEQAAKIQVDQIPITPERIMEKRGTDHGNLSF